MNSELSLYRVWRKLCKKIINLNKIEKEKKEDEILDEICHHDKKTMKNIKSYYYKYTTRKFVKHEKDVC